MASWIVRPDLIDECLAVVSLADIAEPDLAALAAVLLAINEAGKQPTMARIASALRKAKNVRWTQEGALGELLDGIGTGADAVYFAKQVAEAATLRRLDDAARQIRQSVADGIGVPVDDIAAAAQQTVMDACDAGRRSGAVHVAEVMPEALRLLEARFAGDLGQEGVRTGFGSLDAMLGGLRGGQLVILAARPGVGKSALASQIAATVARDAGPVVLASLEMSREECANRMLSQQARVNLRRMNEGTISADDRRAIVQAGSDVSQWPLTIADAGECAVADVMATARRTKRRNGGDLALVVIDYLQLLQPGISGKGVSREQQVSEMTRRLKMGARALDVPVLCLAQLNRKADEVGEPRLSHLRESGSIEQDADVVMFIHPHSKEDETQVTLIVAKQRNGPTGDVPLVWRREFVRFSEPQPARHAAFDRHNGDIPDDDNDGDRGPF